MFRSACALLVAALVSSAPAYAQDAFADRSCTDLLRIAGKSQTPNIADLSQFGNAISVDISKRWPNIPSATIQVFLDRGSIAGDPQHDTSFAHCLDTRGLTLRFQRTDEDIYDIPLRVLALYEKAPVADTYLSGLKPILKQDESASFSMRMNFPILEADANGQASKVVKSAGSTSVPGKNEYYKFIRADAQDLTKGLVVVLCVNACDTAIPQLLEMAEAQETTPAPSGPATPDDQMANAPPDEGDDTTAAPKDTPQQLPAVVTTAIPPWERALSDLVRLEFHLDGAPKANVAYRQTCTSIPLSQTETLGGLLKRLNGPKCLKSGDDSYTFDRFTLRDGSSGSDRLVIDIALKSTQPKALGNLYISLSKLFSNNKGMDFFNCSLLVQFATLPEDTAPSEDVFDATRAPTVLNYGPNPPRFVLPVQDKNRLPLANLALQITAKDTAENTCRLKAPFRVRVFDAVEQGGATLDKDGNLTFEDIGLLPANPDMHVVPDDQLTGVLPDKGDDTTTAPKANDTPQKLRAVAARAIPPWERALSDLVQLEFHLEGAPVANVAPRQTCTSIQLSQTETLGGLLKRLNGPDCLKSADASYTFDRFTVRDGRSDTDMLVIDVTLKSTQPKTLENLYISSSRLVENNMGWDLANCSLRAQLATLPEGATLSGEDFNNDLKTIRYDPHNLRFVLLESDTNGVSLENLALQITAKDTAENTCRLKAPFRARVSDAVAQGGAALDGSGNLTFEDIGLMPANPDMHVFLLSYTRPESRSNEGSKAVYGFDDIRDFQEYAFAYLKTLTSLSEGDTPPNQLIFYAPTQTGVLEEIARKTWAETQDGYAWAKDLLKAVQTAEVDYADTMVTNALTILRNAGKLDDEAKIRIFGRSGFDNTEEHCDNGILTGAPADTEIVEVTKANNFGGLPRILTEDRILVNAKLRTYACDDTGKHHLVFTDSKAFAPTIQELGTVFDAIKDDAFTGGAPQ